MPAKKIACVQCLGFIDHDKGWAWDSEGQFEAWLETEDLVTISPQTKELIAYLMDAAERNNN